MFFADNRYSGTNFERPGFQEILAQIEAGKVANRIVKDLSCLGRNSAMTGLYTTLAFPKYGTRFIAINDNFDSADPNSVNNDFARIKNWFNEFYARDTSCKIRAVQKSKGEKGIPLTLNVPYGYVKDPNAPPPLDYRPVGRTGGQEDLYHVHGGPWPVPNRQSAASRSGADAYRLQETAGL